VNPTQQPARGDVWDLDLDPIKGREQAGRRPALIVSVAPFNRGPADLMVAVPLTRTERGVRWHVPVSSLSARTFGHSRSRGWEATAAGSRRSRWPRSKIGCGFCSGYKSPIERRPLVTESVCCYTAQNGFGASAYSHAPFVSSASTARLSRACPTRRRVGRGIRGRGPGDTGPGLRSGLCARPYSNSLQAEEIPGNVPLFWVAESSAARLKGALQRRRSASPSSSRVRQSRRIRAGV